MAHAPTPYRIGWEMRTITDCNGKMIATIHCVSNHPAVERRTRETVDFVLRACNSHDALLAALEELCRVEDCLDEDFYTQIGDAMQQARAAIAAARGEA